MVDAENEVHVLKRKHASSIRELTKELNSFKKESANSGKVHGASPLSQSSRASSNSSLNRGIANGGEDSLNDNQLHLPHHQRSASNQFSGHNGMGDLTKESLQVNYLN